ncbi:hypothetical protein [Chitinimonas lacunae]|uniref:Uncharacterized protein n=1 Tax=Chitinimonas lacunae TaxID=1963018 RepID=A0ABV8MLW7_9NEIS
MNQEKLLDAIADRDMFSHLKSALKDAGLPVSRGWDLTREQLLDVMDMKPDGDTHFHELQNIYKENLLYADKAVMLWSADREDLNNFTRQLESILRPDHSYTLPYPAPLGVEELKAQTENFIPVKIYESHKKRTVVFCSRRWINEQVTILNSDLKEEILASYADIPEFFGKRKITFQVFDSLTLHAETGLVELRIDRAKHMPEKQIKQLCVLAQARINAYAEACGIKEFLKLPLNLYEAIGHIYKDRSLIIKNLQHQNDAGFDNTNRGRSKKLDVRNDDYHSGGERSVPSIDIYGITALLPIFQNGSPSIILNGHSKLLAQQQSFIDYVKILDCWNFSTYTYTLGRVLQYLPYS